MNFGNFEEIGEFFLSLGVTRAFFKPLSENDNSKQQIYFGSSFQVLQQIPFGKIMEFPENKDPNYKASVNFWWINDSGQTSLAPNTQLILYTRYPEVRLSGFLLNCPTAPREHLQPLLREARTNNNGKDGRVLIMGICPNNKVYGFLAIKDSPLAKTILNNLFQENRATIQEFPLKGLSGTDKAELIKKLHEIVNTGWHESVRLDANGNKKSYQAKNSGGYTLEALFGIIPNAVSGPDFKGWELKAISGAPITLMTPEPDQGFYHEKGAKEFVLKYGHETDKAFKYFTGKHTVDVLNSKTKLTLTIKGFDFKKGTINDMSGGLYLLDENGSPTAVWSFNKLITHWSKKHSHTCYIKYKVKKINEEKTFLYLSPVYMGENTDLSLFLKAMQSRSIFYDPGVKVVLNAQGNLSPKARSQFRIKFKDLKNIYKSFYEQKV